MPALNPYNAPVTHLRVHPGLRPGGPKQIAGMTKDSMVIAVAADGTEVDISTLVTGCEISLTPGEAATLHLTIMGFEIA